MILGNIYNDGTTKWKVVNKLPNILYNSGGEGLLPIGSIVPIAFNNVLPEGFLVCNGAEVLIDDYPELYNIIGNLYGTPSDNLHFVLPDLRNKFVEGSATAGTKIAAGVPNVIGYGYVSSNCGGGAWAVKGTSGAFYSGVKSTSVSVASNMTYGTSDYYLYFDASRFNDIYGNSSTVQPPAVTMIFVIKAYLIEADFSPLQQVLDEKLDQNDLQSIQTSLGNKLEREQIPAFNTKATITTSGTWKTPYEGWYKITLKGGGGGGGGAGKSTSMACTGAGGGEGGTRIRYRYLPANHTLTIIIGAGGTGGSASTNSNQVTGGAGGATSVTINTGESYSAGGGMGGSGNGGLGGTGDINGCQGGQFLHQVNTGYGSPGGGTGGGSGGTKDDAGYAGTQGGGGGGGGASVTPTNTAGGNGGNGYVWIEYFNP